MFPCIISATVRDGANIYIQVIAGVVLDNAGTYCIFDLPKRRLPKVRFQSAEQVLPADVVGLFLVRLKSRHQQLQLQLIGWTMRYRQASKTRIKLVNLATIIEHM